MRTSLAVVLIAATAAAGQKPSPLDKLDPKHIPEGERAAWHPKELVAVLGSLRGASDEGGSISLSRDGKTLAAGDWSGHLRLLDPATLRETAAAPTGPIWCVTVSHDGKLVATISQSPSTAPPRLHLWSVEGGALKPRGEVEAVYPFATCFAPGGTALAVLDRERGGPDTGPRRLAGSVLRLLDLGGAKPAELARAPSGNAADWAFLDSPLPEGIAFSHDGKSLAYAARKLNHSVVRILDIGPKGKLGLRHTLTGKASERPRLAFGKRLVVWDHARLQSWDVSGKAPAKEVDHEELGAIGGVAAAGDALVLARLKRRANAFDPASGPELAALPVKAGKLEPGASLDLEEGNFPGSLALSPDGKTAFVAGTRRVSSFALEDGKPKAIRREAAQARCWSLSFSADGSRLAAGGQGTLRLWRLGGPTGVDLPVPEPIKDMRVIALSPDGKTLAQGTFPYGSLGLPFRRYLPSLWDVGGEKPAALPEAGLDKYGRDDLWAVGFADGKSLVIGVGLVETQRRERLNWSSLSPDGRFAAQWKAGELHVHDLTAKPAALVVKVPLATEGPARLTQSAVGAGGKRIASAGWDGSLRLHSREGDKIETKLLQKGAPGKHVDYPGVAALAFTPDGKSLASADRAGTVIVWDVVRGEKTHEIRFTGRVPALAFAPDGRHLVVGTARGAACILRLEPAK